MCTVTYLPTGSGDFVFTSNRDEAPGRSVSELSRDGRLILPRDQAGGSWIALEQSGCLACILNGAFVKHERHPPYRKSRGMVLIDFFSWSDTHDFWHNYDFTNIEPFTMITVKEGGLAEGRWDGERVHFQFLDHLAPHIWASATLYDEEMRKEREKWWSAFLLEHLETRDQRPDGALDLEKVPGSGLQKASIEADLSSSKLQKTGLEVEKTGEIEKHPPAEVLKFHLTAGSDNPFTALRMRRPEQGVETVSVTQIVREQGRYSMTHHDLLEGQTDQKYWAS
ncbi:MAG: NRDE family protein [Bacteroidota bacterium]